MRPVCAMLANQNINTYIAGEVLIETKPPRRLQTTCKNEEILVTVQERNYSKFSGRKLKKKQHFKRKIYLQFDNIY